MGRDRASGSYFVLLSGSAVTTVSSTRYLVHPDHVAAANQVARDTLPETWRIKITANTGGAMTYTVGSSTLP